MISDDPDAAIEALSDAARLGSPEAVETYLALGDLFKREGDVTRAIRLHRNMLHRPGLPAGAPRRGGARAGRRLPARRDAGRRGRGLPQAHGARGTRWPPPGCATSSSTRSGSPRRSRSTGAAARPTLACSPTCWRRGAASFARPTRPARSPQRARRRRPTRGAPTPCWRSPRRSRPAATGRVALAALERAPRRVSGGGAALLAGPGRARSRGGGPWRSIARSPRDPATPACSPCAAGRWRRRGGRPRRWPRSRRRSPATATAR